jgi:hypothetical protein
LFSWCNLNSLNPATRKTLRLFNYRTLHPVLHFTSLDDLCQGLERLDELRSLSYGGKAISSPPPTSNQVFEIHKESWVGAINLDETHVRQLRQMFKCIQCCSNEHTLPHCPLMKNWIIKKKPRLDQVGSTSQQNTSMGGVNSVLAPEDISSNTSLMNSTLPSIPEDSHVDGNDHVSSVEFDFLSDPNSLDIMTISGTVSPYFGLKFPLGSVRSVHSSKLSADCQAISHSSFNIIVDSGCTKHIFPFQDSFILYKETPGAYVILADKSRVPCNGIGTVCFLLGGKKVIFFRCSSCSLSL